jgi:hypothetical protein
MVPMKIAGTRVPPPLRALAVVAGGAAGIGWMIGSLWLFVYIGYTRGHDPITNGPFYLYVAGVPAMLFAISHVFRGTPRSRTIVSMLRQGFLSAVVMGVVFVAMIIAMSGY